MTTSAQLDRARLFRDLNLAGGLLLPNAWDAASARIFETTGFPAIGTTSGGIANSRGWPDAERMSRDDSVREIATITAAVSVPVTADIEAGYGPTPADVAATVEAVIAAGVVGINLEDNRHGRGPEPLFGIEEQAARLAAARAAADEHDLPLVINARTDTFLLNLGADLDERLAMTVERGRAYLAAGADLVFVPLVVDPALVSRVVAGIDGPVSLMAVPGAPPAAELFAAGASRVSLGPIAMLAALGAVQAIAQEVHDTGTWGRIEQSFYGFGEANALFSREEAPAAGD